VIVKVDAIVATEIKNPPMSETCRARSMEKMPIARMRTTGLMSHQGSEPAPPGLAVKARFAPPPAERRPISMRNFFGELMIYKLHGMVSASGETNRSARRDNSE
jgi:hypothetical protein